MKKVTGYLVRQNGEIIAVTADAREAMYIARNFKGIAYKVVTTIIPMEDPTTETTEFYDGTPSCLDREMAILNA